jgi:DNA-directed RNA polymerase subunit M/transcription elongation factor TFIIS
MRFCENCNNYLYVTLDSEKNLVRYCKNCSHKIIEKNKSICVIDDNKIDDVTRYSQYLNKYITYDPTLPRVNNIDCLNPSCTKKTDQENEIIYVKYDFVNMKYMYTCTHCLYTWRNS